MSDHGILCATHEAMLHPYDTYGIEFCRTFSSKALLPAPNIWRVCGVDGDQLTRFWLAVLWRFSVSALPEAAEVRLGSYEKILRDILFFGASCSPEPAIVIMRYRSGVIPPENVCFPPYVSKFPPSGHLHAYGMAVAGLHAWVKLDHQPLPCLAHLTTINGKHEAKGGYLELEQTSQFQHMLKIAENMSLKPSPPRR